MQKKARPPSDPEGAVALRFGTMQKAIVSTSVAGMVRAGGVLTHLIGPSLIAQPFGHCVKKNAPGRRP
jgi:hypothetical protein